MKTLIWFVSVFVAICPLLSSAGDAIDGGSVQLVKRESASVDWAFVWERRLLNVRASVSPQEGGGNFNISLSSESGADFSAGEITAAAMYVGHQLTALGFQKVAIRRLFLSSVMVGEWRSRLKNAAVKSAEWNASLRNRSTSGAADSSKAVVIILNNTHVFKELEQAFADIGLDINVQSVEEPVTRSMEGLIVPESAMVWISVFPSRIGNSAADPSSR
jgi:hypothetical protein